MIDALVQQGADLLAQDDQGNTAAHHAAAEGHLWVLHYLLTAEQDQHAAGKVLGGLCHNQNTALHYACARGHALIVQYLLTRGFDPEQGDAEGTSAVDIANDRQFKAIRTILKARYQSFTTVRAPLLLCC